jgi:capsid assembly protease
MNNAKILSLFSGQPWAMPVNSWRSLLASIPSMLNPHARDLHARASDGARASAAGPIVLGGEKIGVLRVSGPLVKGVDAETAYWWGFASYDAIHEGIAAAIKEGISTLVLHIDSPGGMVMGLAETASRLEDLKEAGVHLIAYTDTMACSAAYWLAAACHEIVAAPSAYVGSIGCICMAWDDVAFWERIGAKPVYFVNEGSEAKLYGREGIAWTDEARASFQASVDIHGEEFKAFLDAHRPGLARADMNGDAWAANHAPAGYVDHMEFQTASGRRRPVATIGDLLGFLTTPVGL